MLWRSLFYSMLTVGIATIEAGISPLALAGGSASSGGYIYLDDNNPWFLENTEVVSYCVSQDEQNFRLDAKTAKTRIREALTAWQRGFAEADYERYENQMLPYHAVRIATQRFVEEPCTKTTKLRFQLGRLTSAQRRVGIDPERTVAATHREAYDEVSLVGQGYIYIAADRGPLRPTATEMHDTPWTVCDGCVLKGVVMHELGHVFGLLHNTESTYSGTPLYLMHAQFGLPLRTILVSQLISSVA